MANKRQVYDNVIFDQFLASWLKLVEDSYHKKKTPPRQIENKLKIIDAFRMFSSNGRAAVMAARREK